MSKPHIPIAECEDRRAYELDSRNLTVGVYRAASQGFIGLREKFGELYLFQEYHWDTHGTVHPIRPLDVVVPEDILLAERMSGTWCSEENRAVEFRRDDPAALSGLGKWFHLDDGTVLGDGDLPFSKSNERLMDLLFELTPWAREWRDYKLAQQGELNGSDLRRASQMREADWDNEIGW